MIECKSENGRLTYTLHSHSYTAPFEVVPDNSMPSAEWYSPETGTYFDGYGRLIVDGEVSRAEAAIQRLSRGPSGNSALPAANAFEYTETLEGEANPKDYPLPRRATSGSAGYDIFSPFDVSIEPGQCMQFSLGIKCRIKPGEFLMVVPRSSMGFNGRHVVLTNTVGVIDSDYYGNPSTGGEIHICLKNEGKHAFSACKGGRLAQAIFVRYDTAAGDDVLAERVGGFGSTDD